MMNHNNYSHNNIYLVLPNTFGLPLNNGMGIPNQNSNILLQDNSSLFSAPNLIGVQVQNGSNLPLQNDSTEQTPVTVQNNFVTPSQNALLPSVQESALLPTIQNTIGKNIKNNYEDFVPLYGKVKTEVEENSLNLDRKKPFTEAINGGTSCKIEIKPETLDPDDYDYNRIQTQTECLQLKTDPLVSWKEEMEIKEETIDSCQNDNEDAYIQNADLKAKNEVDLLGSGKAEVKIDIKEEPMKIDIKEEPIDSDQRRDSEIVSLQSKDLKTQYQSNDGENASILSEDLKSQYQSSDSEDTSIQSEDLERENQKSGCEDASIQNEDLETQNQKSDREDSSTQSVDMKIQYEMKVLGRKSLGISLRRNIIALFEAGLNKKDIAGKLGVARMTVHKWIKRWKEEGDLYDHPRKGSQRKTTPEQDQDIVREAINNPFTNATQIKSNLNLEVSVETVRKRLLEAGVKLYVPSIKQTLMTDPLNSGKEVPIDSYKSSYSENASVQINANLETQNRMRHSNNASVQKTNLIPQSKGMNGKVEPHVIRKKIIKLFKTRMSKHGISRKLGIAVKTVRKWILRYLEKRNLNDHPRLGPSRITTRQQDSEIVTLAKRNPSTTTKEIKRELNLNISSSTILRRIRETGFDLDIPIKRQKPT